VGKRDLSFFQIRNSGFIKSQGKPFAAVTRFLYFFSLVLSFSTIAAAEPSLVSKSYRIDEVHYRTSSDEKPYQALREFLFYRFLSDSSKPILMKVGTDLRQMAIGLARMQQGIDAFPEEASLSPEQTDQKISLQLQLRVAQEAYKAVDVLEVILNEKIARALESKPILAEFYSTRSLNQVLTEDEKNAEQGRNESAYLIELREVAARADRISSEIWELREKGVAYGREEELKLGTETFNSRLDKNELFQSNENGRAELNTIDEVIFVRAIHRDLTDAFTFKSSEKIQTRSQHNKRYTASQHVKSGKDRRDGVRGRHEIACYTTKVDGGEVVDHVRVHLMPSKWSWQYREDNILFLDFRFEKDSLKKELRQGLIFGFAQGLILGGMDLLMNQMGIPTEYRPALYLYTVGFSTFWGIFQTQLRKFTNDPMLPWYEKTLRRMVTTGIPYNTAAFILSHGIYAFDLLTPGGWVNSLKMTVNLTLSNAIKNWMEKPVETDVRKRGSATGPWTLLVPSKCIPGMPLTNDLVEINMGTKESNARLRAISLLTFTYRLADITDFKVRVPYLDYDIPIGKALFWGALPYYQWKAVKHAESVKSDLAPQLRAKWDTPIKFLFLVPIPILPKPVLFKYVIPIVPFGVAGAYFMRLIGKGVRKATLLNGELANRAFYTTRKKSANEVAYPDDNLASEKQMKLRGTIFSNEIIYPNDHRLREIPGTKDRVSRFEGGLIQGIRSTCQDGMKILGGLLEGRRRKQPPAN